MLLSSTAIAINSSTCRNRRHNATCVGTRHASRLDYCNSVLAALQQSTIEPLQCVLNTAARLIFNLGRCEHVSPCLIQLHWLPIRHRITYKLCTLIHPATRVIWPTWCSLRLPEWHAPVCALSLKQPATSHLGCAPSLESALSLSPAQRHGTLSPLNYAPFLIQVF